MKTVILVATGRVQGVGFRYMTKYRADLLKIYGIVKNQEDGTVYIEANGPEEKLNRFIEVVRASPSPSGNVTHLEVIENPAIKLRDKFTITD
ncbi:acylphosphatase [Isobaculum melis]|uniref:acylphosphatase n=1 Tax=Isobaculum melis TaxID=142588 RepID=A0A1H9UHG1_9LACT|nr:acylphosphatase [Isobaculum melis]SES08597.1 acylphosphatase [Isobaculum melis]